MTARILIIGGYGNFGSFIAKELAQEETIQLIVAGRSQDKAAAFARSLNARNAAEAYALDINQNLETPFAAIKPNIVIHTSGPFQSQTYRVAEACIAQACHYIDLADARAFVTGITALDVRAKERNVLICSGASSVPCLTGALIDHYSEQFTALDRAEYGIATAQLTNRGLATTSAVLSYAGKKFQTLTDGRMTGIYGWQDLRLRNYDGLGRRLMGNCDIPDLALFPARYPTLKTIRFQAGLELKILHLGLWLLSWAVRLKLLASLEGLAPHLLPISRLFDPFGRDDSGFYMELSGAGPDGSLKTVTFDLVARKGDGLYIPSIPAILMARKLAKGEIPARGAAPCLGFITLDEYLAALGKFNIRWHGGVS